MEMTLEYKIAFWLYAFGSPARLAYVDYACPLLAKIPPLYLQQAKLLVNCKGERDVLIELLQQVEG